MEQNNHPIEWDEDIRACEEFYAAHPECPKTKNIEVLNLVMKKEFAEQILRGEKTVEFRSVNDFYYKRIYDHDVVKFMNEHGKEPEFEGAIDEGIIYPIRQVLKIHFHNYSNSWYLDVECIANNDICVTRPQVKDLQDDFNCHELDEMLEDLEARKAEDRPMFFYFALGKVLDTNLKV